MKILLLLAWCGRGWSSRLPLPLRYCSQTSFSIHFVANNASSIAVFKPSETASPALYSWDTVSVGCMLLQLVTSVTLV